MAKQINLRYALKNGHLISVEDVEPGLKCACVCPACGEKLVAKKGSKMTHHFAHFSGSDCEYGYESSLHLAAKSIIAEHKELMIPAVYVSFDSSKSPLLVSEARKISFDRVELEFRLGEIVPDIVLYAGNKQLYVEIYVTHRVDDVKREKIKENGVSAIEIDLSHTDHSITQEELTDIILKDSALKTWIFNSVANAYNELFLKYAKRFDMVSRGFAVHIDYCPIRKKVWKGKPYANFMEDCTDCEFFIAEREDKTRIIDPEYGEYQRYILCSGERKVSTIEDLKRVCNHVL